MGHEQHKHGHEGHSTTLIFYTVRRKDQDAPKARAAATWYGSICRISFNDDWI